MRKFAIVVAALMGTTACIPIPMWRQATVRPALELTLTTHEGKPAPEVEVRIRRFISGPPPDTETHRWIDASDAEGKLVLEALEQQERYAPLMMHGVNWYAWQICADHPKYGVATHRIGGTQPLMPAQTVALQLDPQVPGCDWTPMSPP